MTATFTSSRTIPYSPSQVFNAYADANMLASWWGPNGFTNEFETFEFKTGGNWVFTMIGPNGSRYANKSLFLEISPHSKIVIRHDCAPYFTLVITLTPVGDKTEMRWEGTFDDAHVYEAIKHIVVPANEQNFDRIIATLGKKYAG